jgi:preflagellin peptidase FlaK
MGGADTKVLWTLSFLNPLPPKIFSLPLFFPRIFIFPLVIFINSLLLIVFLPFIFLIYNAIKGNLEFPYCFLGYKLRASEAKEKFVWSMEKNGKKKVLPVKDFNFEEIGHKKIWVTPKLPFLVFIFIGFIISYTYGDILLSLLLLFID